MNNEEWDIAVPLFKKNYRGEDWKKVGHVQRHDKQNLGRIP